MLKLGICSDLLALSSGKPATMQACYFASNAHISDYASLQEQRMAHVYLQVPAKSMGSSLSVATAEASA